jgi:hypothetical protein
VKVPALLDPSLNGPVSCQPIIPSFAGPSPTEPRSIPWNSQGKRRDNSQSSPLSWRYWRWLAVKYLPDYIALRL